MPPSPRQTLLRLLKKILRTAMVIVQGIIIGLGLNYSWHYFLAEYLGWGDSAPDWYFQVQGMIFMAFFLLGLIGWAVFYSRFDGYLTRRKIIRMSGYLQSFPQYMEAPPNMEVQPIVSTIVAIRFN